MVGFGISSREHVEEIAAFADGAIVASALLDAIGRAAPGTELEVAQSYIKSLKGI
jgi:tryptophan synthase alpha chain